ncbi:ATP-dependent zinc metalloprotease FtsH 2 [Peptococcaceae bacterium CEB3]|nr:ATP-dependent zinc metalloprotease FtsH 2 [Peptococcaceae bacterium CEB3]
MPKLDHVLSLINTVGQRDYRRARQCVEAMIAQERQNRREQAAKSLERALNHWPNQSMVELPQDVSRFVWSEQPKRSLDSLYLTVDVQKEIRRFFNEWEHAEQIQEAGLSLTNKLLLTGPPGNGKTSLAEALAKSFGLTFLPIKLHTVIDGHMGSSGKNLGKLFEFASFNNVVLFIDELDAIGSFRSSGVGDAATKEYNVVVNTLLTNLDRFPDTGVVIGATNLPDALDPALERRFNIKLWLDNPTEAQIEAYLDDYQQAHSVRLFPESVSHLAGLPWSRIEEFCMNKHKDLILGEFRTSTGV